MPSRPRPGSSPHPVSGRQGWDRWRRRWWRSTAHRCARRPPRRASGRSRTPGCSPRSPRRPVRRRPRRAPRDSIASITPGPPQASTVSPGSIKAAAAMAEVTTSSAASMSWRANLAATSRTSPVGVVGDERELLTGIAQAPHGLGRAGDRLVAEPHHAIEVDRPSHRLHAGTWPVTRLLDRRRAPLRAFPRPPLQPRPSRARRGDGTARTT